MSNSCPESGARVYLAENGVVTLNGRKVEAARLQDALKALSPRPTVVCYSRENPDSEPHQSMSIVLDAIISMNLPVGLFTDSTFTTPLKPQ
jgi:hypothetical protein